MTPAPSDGRNIVVVDGSNIATEGRSMPSLAQLNEAVLSFRDERPEAAITVVVDATFGHRIDKSEKAEFDEAVAHNELVAPPAGAVGRGDAFVLSIANKVGATILSNDSFQEFHGDYPWLFDAGRLVGGKPVPNIGWVFVERVPVKGPVSRKARSTAKRKAGAATPVRHASKLASQPMPMPKTPPPGLVRAKEPAPTAEPVPAAATAPRRRSGDATPVNDLLPFLEFVERHPVGSSVSGVVESYSSHGAYVAIGDLRGYVPLRLMGDPPPRSAREVMKLGEAVTLVVVGFAPARRNVDLSLPGAPADAPVAEQPAADAERPSGTSPRGRKRSASGAPDEARAPEPATEVPPKRGRKAATTTTAPDEPVAEPPATTPAKAPKATKAAKATKTSKAATATTATKTSKTSKTTKATKAARAATGPGATTAATKVAPAKTAATPDVPATPAAAEKVAATRAAAKSPAAKQAASKKAAAKSPAAKQAASKKAAAKSPAAKQAAAKQAATKKIAAKAAAAPTTAGESAASASPARKRASKQTADQADGSQQPAAPRGTRAKKAAT